MRKIKLSRRIVTVAAGMAALGLWGHPSFGAEPTPPDPKVAIEAIHAQFFYENSGTLSENVAPPAKFDIWNTVIAEGSAKEPATDVLVSVVLKVPGDAEVSIHGPLTLTVRAGKTILAQRSFREMLLERGTVTKGVWLRDGACKGKVTIEAAIGATHKTVPVIFGCGE
jgi:hypothetical protein